MTESIRGSKPSVTVCIPLYHHAGTVERALRSVLEQDHGNFEILIVDDASTDNGADLALAMVRDGDRVIVNDTRLGAVGNHNRCIELARGNLIQFVHGDDELLPGALSALSATFEKWADVALAFAPRRLVTDDEAFRAHNGILHRRFADLRPINDADTLIEQNAYEGLRDNWFGEPSSVMFRRDLALQVGGFTSGLVQIFDYDLWVHMSAGHRIAFVDRDLAIRHHSAETLSNANTSAKKNWLDHTTILLGVVVDRGMSRRSRVYAGLWLMSALPFAVRDAVRSPPETRKRRLRTIASLPRAEVRRRRTPRRRPRRRQTEKSGAESVGIRSADNRSL